MQVFRCDSGHDIASCAAIIKKQKGVVVFPTDTIYGIGCDPYSDAAVERIFAIKGRREDKPLPVLVAGMQVAEELVDLGDVGRRLAERFWPGALTIVAPLKDKKISAKVTGGKKDSLAVRVPANRCVLALLQECRCLVGTSANLSGGKPSSTAEQVLRQSGLQGYDALLADDRPLAGRQSTIVDITATGAKPTIVRHGAVSASDIDAALAGA
jgi:L-threonylcarbamoyladenylate synthase